MKNKIRLITVAAALLIGSMPLTAFAQVPDNVDTSVIDCFWTMFSTNLTWGARLTS